MTEKTLAELRAETDRLMRRSLHKTLWPELEYKARMAALAVERNAADAEIERLTREIERLTRERDEARAEVEMLREMRELDKALEEAERLLALAKAQEEGYRD